MSSTETQGIVARPGTPINSDAEVSVNVREVQWNKKETRELGEITLDKAILNEGVNTVIYAKEDGTLGKIVLIAGIVDFDADEVMPKEGSRAPAKTPYIQQVFLSTNNGFPGFEIEDPNDGKVHTVELSCKMEKIRWLQEKSASRRG